MAGEKPDNPTCAEFVRGKLQELGDYMVTQDYGYDQTGAILIGIGAGWVARERDKETSYRALDMARTAVEAHGVKRQ